MTRVDTSKSIELIYNAITRPDLWAEVVQSLVRDSRSNSGLLCVERTDQRAILTFNDFGLSDKAMDDYADYYVGKDIWLEKLFTLSANEFHLSHEMTPQKTFLNSEIYNDWGTFEQIQHATGVLVDSPMPSANEAVLRFCLQRSDSEGEYTPEEKAALNSVVPHMRRAIAVHSDLVSLQLINNNASRILDQLPFAAFLLDDKCRIEYRNAGADALFGDESDFQESGNTLGIEPHQGAFERIVHEAVLAGQGCDVPLHRALRLNGTDGLLQYEVSVSPLLVDDFQLCFQYQRMLALVIVREVVDGQIPEAVIDSYAISRAEAEVAQLLCAGMSAVQIADAHHRSLHTVRTHIKNLLHKTGTTSQGELVARLLSGVAPVAPRFS